MTHELMPAFSSQGQNCSGQRSHQQVVAIGGRFLAVLPDCSVKAYYTQCKKAEDIGRSPGLESRSLRLFRSFDRGVMLAQDTMAAEAANLDAKVC